MHNDVGLCVVSASLAGGGAEKVAVNLANYFAARRGDVDLVVLRRSDDAPYRAAIDPRVRVVSLDGARVRHSVLALRRYLQARRPAKLLSVTRDSNVVAAVASCGMRPRPAMFFREANPYQDLDVLGWKGRLLRLAMRWSYRRAQMVIANSDATRRDVLTLNIPGLRVDVISNPVLPDDHAARVPAPAGHPWCADRSLRVVLAVGRLDPQKDYPTLLEAFALVHAEEPAARLIVLGTGAQEAPLRVLARTLGIGGVVDFAGFAPDPAPYYAAARVFASSSRWEGFGNVLVEALAAGTSVVATDCPGSPREILAGGTYGDLVPVGDHRALAAAVVRNLQQPPDPALLKKRAADFTVGRIGPQYAEALGLQ